jgi:hypothetical protein
MPYFLIDYVSSGAGAAPAVPHDTGFLLLAAPAVDSVWGLFDVDRELPLSRHVRPVAEATDAAIRSAIRYPPPWRSPGTRC